MKLKLTLTALLICAISFVSAQHYAEDYVIPEKGAKRYREVKMINGFMVGTVMPKLSEKQDRIDISNKAGFALGMMWGVDLGRVEIVPELWYSHSKTTLSEVGEEVGFDMVTNSIEVPIIFALPIANSGLRFNVGPTFALMSDSKLKIEGEEDIDFGRTRHTAGYLIGVSWTLIDHLILDFRYTGRYVSTKSEWVDGGEEYDYRYINFGLNVGYRF